MGRGLFIVLEGTNRTHKHDFAQILRKQLKKQTGQEIVVCRPRHRTSASCPILPNFLQGYVNPPDQIVHHLFSVDRWRLSYRLQYLLNRGHTVILQRYVTTGHAYTLANGHLDLEWCKQFDTGLLKPDVLIYMEKDPLLLESTFDDPDIYENPDMQTKIINQFNRLKEPDWLIVDVSRSNPKQALEQVLPTVMEKLRQTLEGELELTYYD